MNILFCSAFDDLYFLGAAVMLYSMHKNIKEFSRYEVRLFYHNEVCHLSTDNREWLSAVFGNVNFMHICQDAFLNAQGKKVFYLSLESFRQSDFEKVVYFDMDMLCLKDFTEVLYYDFDFAACNDTSGCLNVNSPYISIGFPEQSHWINAGLYIVGEKLIGDQYYQKLIDIVRSESDLLEEDQSVINLFLKKIDFTYCCLPFEYNYRILKWHKTFKKESDISKTKILHFTGPKPWIVSNENDYRDYYLNYKLDTLYYNLWKQYFHELLDKLPRRDKQMLLQKISL